MNMPRYDQTGPMGQGSGTGRRMGPCYSSDVTRQPYGYRRLCGRGRGQGSFMGLLQPGTGDNWLASRKAVLEKELEYINSALKEKDNK
jgi:hypothetical protein